MKIKKTPIAFAVSIALLTQYPSAWAADQAATGTPEASEAAKKFQTSSERRRPCHNHSHRI